MQTSKTESNPNQETAMATEKRYAEVNHGTRTIMGTDWPVTSYVTKSGRKWVATHKLCNGVPQRTTVHTKKRDAKAAIAD